MRIVIIVFWEPRGTSFCSLYVWSPNTVLRNMWGFIPVFFSPYGTLGLVNASQALFLWGEIFNIIYCELISFP